MTPLILSRARLVDFLDCPRRFELRYLRQLAWPTVPLDEETAVSLQNGQQFHNLLERHFLHLPTDNTASPSTIANWYNTFQQSEMVLPSGDYLPELTLTVPIGDHFLTGRFDLLIREANGRLNLFDWKTGHPRSEAALRADWQTRLYLAMVVKSGQAISPDPIAPKDVSITYWYVEEPDAPRRIQYDAAWHGRNWAEIRQLVDKIDVELKRNNQQSTVNSQQSTWEVTDKNGVPIELSRRLSGYRLSKAEATATASTSSASAISTWEKTAVLDHCRRCAYRIYCDRQDNDHPSAPLATHHSPLAAATMEPALP